MIQTIIFDFDGTILDSEFPIYRAWNEIFQAACLDVVYGSDENVVVSAPTGSGKTYVAIEATKRAMQENRTVIYTSPLKALSNTKFTEFSRLFGPGQVGILTGDRREHAQAPLLRPI